jgi:hypothetical protein
MHTRPHVLVNDFAVFEVVIALPMGAASFAID